MIKRIVDKVYHKVGILKRFNGFIIGSNESENIKSWRGEEILIKREYSMMFSTSFKKNQIKTIKSVSQILFKINRLIISNGESFTVKSIKINDNELLIQDIPGNIFDPIVVMPLKLDTICNAGQNISLTIKRIK